MLPKPLAIGDKRPATRRKVSLLDRLMGFMHRYADFYGRTNRRAFFTLAFVFVLANLAANYLDTLDGERVVIAGRMGAAELLVTILFSCRLFPPARVACMTATVRAGGYCSSIFRIWGGSWRMETGKGSYCRSALCSSDLRRCS